MQVRKHSDFQRPDGEQETYACAGAGLRTCIGAKATGSFTTAAGSGDRSAGVIRPAPHPRADHPPSGSSSASMSRTGPLFSKRLPLVCSSRAFAKSAGQLFVGHKQMLSKQSRCDLHSAHTALQRAESAGCLLLIVSLSTSCPIRLTLLSTSFAVHPR